MPLKTVKKDAADKLTLEWILQVKNYKLTLDKKRCAGCQICSLACPKEAIKVEKQPKIAGQKAKKAKVDVDLVKCNFCGICDITCPYGAIKVTLNDEHAPLVVVKESFPELIRDMKVDTRQCPKECDECEAACPLGLIKVSKVTFDGKPVENFEALSPSQKSHVRVNLAVQKEYCPTCRVCEFKCAPGAIKVRKFIEGKIAIEQAKCPEGCTDCLDVCPISGALSLGEDGKVHVNEAFCDYCGACKAVCPVDDALALTRTKILHTPVRSGTWNKALVRLTSCDACVQEFKAIAAKKRKDVVAKRFTLEETIR
ncbi:4Fe-4S dicluster domain-containing protein [Candidatus Bathyarchaeota archaeon]|nr:4Fe-4S dicluster domain-containing protein [Candidatus Bathyarchaeota archaeon]